YGRVFREIPQDPGVRDQLNRLASILEDWEGIANIYQEYLDDETGDSPSIREIALQLATIYDRRLGEVERGQAAYRRVLQGAPDDFDTCARLEAMLTGAERWYALIDTYEEAIQASLDDARRVELYERIARVQETRLQDVDQAIDAFRAILDIEPDHPRAQAELERLYRASGQW